MNLEDLRKVVEDKLISRGMDEDIALQVADEIVEHFAALEEELNEREDFDYDS
jgi:hypothetical protein